VGISTLNLLSSAEMREMATRFRATRFRHEESMAMIDHKKLLSCVYAARRIYRQASRYFENCPDRNNGVMISSFLVVGNIIEIPFHEQRIIF
jgi:hypothetical protein